MDEADILSDNIVIIANGKLVANNTNYELKQKYGSGYYLTLVKKDIDEETLIGNTSTETNGELALKKNDYQVNAKPSALKTLQDQMIH